MKRTLTLAALVAATFTAQAAGTSLHQGDFAFTGKHLFSSSRAQRHNVP